MHGSRSDSGSRSAKWLYWINWQNFVMMRQQLKCVDTILFYRYVHEDQIDKRKQWVPFHKGFRHFEPLLKVQISVGQIIESSTYKLKLWWAGWLSMGEYYDSASQHLHQGCFHQYRWLSPEPCVSPGASLMRLWAGGFSWSVWIGKLAACNPRSSTQNSLHHHFRMSIPWSLWLYHNRM